MSNDAQEKVEMDNNRFHEYLLICNSDLIQRELKDASAFAAAAAAPAADSREGTPEAATGGVYVAVLCQWRPD